MGIKDMLVREDFYKILRDTIIEYVQMVLGKKMRCDYVPFDGCEAWVVNSVLGFVSRKPVPYGVRNYMKSEYNVRGSIVKNLLGKVAVDLITTFPNIGATRNIYVSKGIFDGPVFIVPQNRSIRFYNYETMQVECIVKSGFTSKYFDNQAAFRNAYNYDFMNPMMAQGKGWFREPVLQGHPLVRTTDEKLFVKGMEDALRYLKILATDTLEYTHSKEYIDGLKTDAIAKIEKAKVEKEITKGDIALQLVEKAVSLASKENEDIPTCISHGDFQSGNIWIQPNGKTLIYDWETAGRRSVWYDSATLSYSLRRAYGWQSMLKDQDYASLFNCLPDGVKTSRSKVSISGILLLEDILFYLDDMLELPENWGNSDFDRFIGNMEGQILKL